MYIMSLYLWCEYHRHSLSPVSHHKLVRQWQHSLLDAAPLTTSTLPIRILIELVHDDIRNLSGFRGNVLLVYVINTNKNSAVYGN